MGTQKQDSNSTDQRNALSEKSPLSICDVLSLVSGQVVDVGTILQPNHPGSSPKVLKQTDQSYLILPFSANLKQISDWRQYPTRKLATNRMRAGYSSHHIHLQQNWRSQGFSGQALAPFSTDLYSSTFGFDSDPNLVGCSDDIGVLLV